MNNQTTGGWNDTCNASAGDFCDNNVPGASYTFSSAPGSSYDAWVHACNVSGCSTPTHSAVFTCTGTDYTTWLTDLYWSELGRAPDPAGFNYYLGQLTTGTMTQEQVTASIHNSPEAVQYRFLYDVYKTELGREPDSAGLAYWMNQLLSGAMTQEEVRTAIHNSPEAVAYRASLSTGVQNTTSSVTSGTSAPTTSFTYEWTRDLKVGSPYTADVKALQTALTREGVYTGEITGEFYNKTSTAVKAFQRKYGIEATGFVGLETRAKLNALY